VTKLEDRFANDHGNPWPEFVAAPGYDRQADHPRPAAPPRGGGNLPRRIAGLVLAVALIIVASYFIGGIAGHLI